MKSPNVLIKNLTSSGDFQVTIADSGTTKSYHPDLPLAGRNVDNPVWLAPEVLANLPYGPKVDTYAFGYDE